MAIYGGRCQAEKRWRGAQECRRGRRDARYSRYYDAAYAMAPPASAASRLLMLLCLSPCALDAATCRAMPLDMMP